MRPIAWVFIFALLIMLGSVLPWVDTIAGSLSGHQGAGLWTLSGGAIVLAGGLLHSVLGRRWVTVAHAAIGGAAALVLAGWQGLRLLRLCGGGACAPGVGLVLVLVGGIGALLVAGRLARDDSRVAG